MNNRPAEEGEEFRGPKVSLDEEAVLECQRLGLCQAESGGQGDNSEE